MNSFSQSSNQESLRVDSLLQSLNVKEQSITNDLEKPAHTGQDDSKATLIPDSKPNLNENPKENSKKRGRQAKYDGAQFPHLLDQAKAKLGELNYDIGKLLELEQFAVLRGSTDVPKFLSKFILNKANSLQLRSIKSGSVIDHGEHLGIKQKHFADQQEAFKQPYGGQMGPPDNEIRHHSMNQGEKIQQEITSTNIREYMLLQPSDRYEFLERISKRNNQDLIEFLMKLKSACSSNYVDGIFRIIYELVQSSRADILVKARIFTQSLLYYRDEILELDTEILIHSMNLLSQKPNIEQTLGIAKLVIFNENEDFTNLKEALNKMDQNNIGIIPLLHPVFCFFKVDSQVIRLLPNSLNILRKSFIKVLKKDCGLILIRDVPVSLVADFICIVSLVQIQDHEALLSFIQRFRDIFVQKWDFLDQEEFSYYVNSMSNELRKQNPFWIIKGDQIVELAEDLATLSYEKKVFGRRDIIDEVLIEDTKKLKSLLLAPKQTQTLSTSNLSKALNDFRGLNPDQTQVQDFTKLGLRCFEIDNSIIIEIEQVLGLKFLELQKLCLNYLDSKQEKFSFINFGIGNGKTLLSTAVAILIAKKCLCPVYVIGENEHLVLRDEKCYESLITRLGLQVNLNQFKKEPGIYYCTQKHLEQNMVLPRDKELIAQSIFVVDEYDWVMLDGSAKQMKSLLSIFRSSQRVIGFTGSLLTQKELSCITIAFEAKETIFPNLNSIKGDKKKHLEDKLYTINQYLYLQAMLHFCTIQIAKSPVLLVASQMYDAINSFFSKQKQVSFFSFKNSKVAKIEASIEGNFLQKDAYGRYGIYLLTEAQGRGTDFKTSQEIVASGGISILICDIFSRRSAQQIIGRVGRLDDPGVWSYFLYEPSSNETVSNLIRQRQDQFDNLLHIKFSKLLSDLSCQDGIRMIGNENGLQQIPVNRKEANQEGPNALESKESVQETANHQAIEQPKSSELKAISQTKCSNILQRKSGTRRAIKDIDIVSSSLSSESQPSERAINGWSIPVKGTQEDVEQAVKVFDERHSKAYIKTQDIISEAQQHQRKRELKKNHKDIAKDKQLKDQVSGLRNDSQPSNEEQDDDFFNWKPKIPQRLKRYVKSKVAQSSNFKKVRPTFSSSDRS